MITIYRTRATSEPAVSNRDRYSRFNGKMKIGEQLGKEWQTEAPTGITASGGSQR